MPSLAGNGLSLFVRILWHNSISPLHAEMHSKIINTYQNCDDNIFVFEQDIYDILNTFICKDNQTNDGCWTYWNIPTFFNALYKYKDNIALDVTHFYVASDRLNSVSQN